MEVQSLIFSECVTFLMLKITVRFQNTGIYEIYNPKALAVAPATKGLRVISFVVPCVLNSLTFIDHRHILVPVTAAVTMKHCENVAVISSNNSLLCLIHTGSQRYGWSSHLFCIILEAGGIYRK